MTPDVALRDALDRVNHAATVLAYALHANQRTADPIDLTGPVATAYQAWREAHEQLEAFAGDDA